MRSCPARRARLSLRPFCPCSREVSYSAAFLCVTLPQGILAASGAKNDWVLGFWLSAVVLFLLRWNRDPGWLSSCNLGLAIGAALLTKGSVYPFLLPLITAIFIWSIRPKRKFLLQAMPVAAAAIIVMNGPQWTRNYSLGGSIIGLSAPDVAGKEKYTVDRFSVAGIASNVIREAGMHLGTPIDSLNQRETNALRKIIVLMGVDPDDPALTNYSRFEIPHAYFIRDEYYAGNPLHLALALLTFGALLLIRKARSPANLTIAIGVTAAFILYCALFKWEIWCARLHLPLFVISAAVVAVVLCRTFPKLVLPVTITALVLAIPPALLNETRPLLFSGGFHNLSTNRTSIFLRSRPELYFTQQSELKATYLPAAQAIRDEKCGDIGFDTSVRPYAHEYPLIELGKATNEEPSFRYVDVHNLSSKYADASDHRSPCLVVCPDCRDRSDKSKDTFTGSAGLVIGLLGALEGKYGRTQYFGDWISYLNVSRSLSAFHWKASFDPMWNPGYPALVAMARFVLPGTPEGEWNAITLLNWLIFLFAYACWRYLIREALGLYHPCSIEVRNRPLVVWTGCCSFFELRPVSRTCVERKSRSARYRHVPFGLRSQYFSPDSTARNACGGTGHHVRPGYCIKSAFLPFGAIFLFNLWLAWRSKQLALRLFILPALVSLAMFASYASAISWNNGYFTLGATGKLNYSFHVNHMPHWTNWQGGPGVFGTPEHRTKQLISDLPVFGFGEPFQTTYPPYNNMAYWYLGARYFWSLKLQVLAIARALYFLARIVKANPYLYLLAFTVLAIMMKVDWRISLGAAAKRLWPVFLPAALSFATYLTVHVEERYLSAFVLIFSLFPLLPLLNSSLSSRRILVTGLLVIYLSGTAAELMKFDGSAFRAAIVRYDYHRDAQWRLASAMPMFGLQPGDAVALVDDSNPGYRCHWGTLQLRIVAEFGSLPWMLAPWDHTRFERTLSEPADQDYALLFWKKLTSERRAQVIDAFRQTTARAIVSLSVAGATPEPGWKRVFGTTAWIYHLKP